MDDQSFTVVESEEIQKLFSLLNPVATTPSADTIKNGIMEKFKSECIKVCDTLQVFI
jgi:hypothetical protein